MTSFGVPSAPPTSLLPDSRYDRMTSLFEGDQPSGWHCTTIPQLKTALQQALQVTDHQGLTVALRAFRGSEFLAHWRGCYRVCRT